MSNETDLPAQLTPLKRAFLAIEDLQARLAASESARREPIALIGIGCRLPGNANSPDALWQLLRDGIDAIGEVPPDRWDIDAYYDPDFSVPGKMSSRHGGFLRDIDHFDPQFFGIAPREAAAMDPQQRLLLEVAWEALEHAGMAPAKLAGSRTGVFVGITSGDYAQLSLSTCGPEGLDAYYASGIAHSIASGRLSYVLGLEGPSVSLDTACSSSLVAVHLAVQSLRQGECRMALAGGVNLILTPETTITLSKYQMMAPDGRCKFADARADGFVRAEGCALVVLKRLSDAIADGDRVIAVIRGSAANQDGASSGLTAPNGPSQEAVLRAALVNGGIAPGEVSYIEAHGTGTALGDPIELQALGAVFGSSRPENQPLVVGSVKTNVGHLEAAAGVTSLIKLALMFQHGAIPASLHFSTPNPHIAWEDLPISVPVALQPWETGDRRRIAGVSSFGFSGTNVHLVVEDAPVPQAQAPTQERPLHLLALSARSEPALRDLASRYARHLTGQPELPLADIAYTANSGRSHFAHRLAAIAADSAGVAEQLAAFIDGQSVPGLRCHYTQQADPPKVAFLFTGQGAQYAGMGRALYQSQPVFRAALDRCVTVLADLLDRPLLDLLFAEPGSADASLLDQTTYTQPALVALEYALAELWRSWGVEPAMVLGHSVGEYAAAIIAGVLSLEDGLALVAARGRLMGQLPAGGAMAAIFTTPEQVEDALADYAGQVCIAAYNGPEHTVVAGPVTEIQSVIDQFIAAGVRAQRLNVSHAFHSALLDPMLEDFARAAGKITFQPPRARLISNLTGAPAGGEIARPEYWRRHAREAVRYAQGVEQLARLGCEVFIEIGPHPTLISMAQTVLPAPSGAWLPSLRKGRDDWQQLLDSVAGAYIHGVNIDWASFDRPYARRKLALPTYPFQRERYWVEPRRGLRKTPTRSSAGDHPLLGRRLRSALRQVQFEQELGPGVLAYLDDHQVFGVTILPAAAFAELALSAGRAYLRSDALALDELLIHAPLIVEADELRILQTVLSSSAPDAVTVEIFSQAADAEEWTLHAEGTLHTLPAAPVVPAAPSLAELRARCAEEVPVGTHYARLESRGLELGPSLQAVRTIWRGESEAFGELVLADAEALEIGHYLVHPALLDASLQLLAAALPAVEETYLPIAIDRLRVYARPGAQVMAHARLLPTEGSLTQGETLTGVIQLFDEAGRLLAALDGLRLKRATGDSLRRPEHGTPDDWLYEVAWRSMSVDTPALPMADFLAPPDTMSAAAHTRIVALSAELNLAHYRSLIPALEVLATNYIGIALHRLGWRPLAGERFTVGELAARLAVTPAQHALFERFLTILGEDGVLRATDNGWEVVRLPDVSVTQGRAEELVALYPASRGEIEITRRCGESLAEALRGEVDPLQLLFPGGSLTTAEQLYRESPVSRAYTALAGEAAAAAMRGLPVGRTLRVLEIGAGTGSATSALLPRLPADRTSYTFTDISPLFLARARESFAAYPFVEYRTLDIEADPLGQGFDPHSFDLVIAANIIHATADLRHSFANLRRLLAPAGVVLLIEMTVPLRWIDISFGLTDGWWKFSDRDLRPRYPLLGQDAWLALLQEVGLELAEAIPAAGVLADGLDHQQILIARNPHQLAVEDELPPDLRNLLIFADADGVGEQLAGLIAARGGRAALISRGAAFMRTGPASYQVDPGCGDQIARLLRERLDPAQDRWDAAIYLWPLDMPGLEPGGDPEEGQQIILGGALYLAQALVLDASIKRLWLVSRGAQAADGAVAEPAQATIWGFGKSLALEHPELRVVCVDLDPAPEADIAVQLRDELLRGDEAEVAIRGTERLVTRLTRTSVGATQARGAAPEEQPVELVITERGALDNLALRPTTRRAPGPGEVEIRVAATSLNFKDVLNVLGMYPGDPGQPGSECAGTVVAVGAGVTDLRPGDEVIALVSGSFRTFATVATEFVTPRPPNLSPEQAITIPIAYVTAAFALQHLGHMRAGERVLIHAAAGGVGMAAVHLARRAGVEIFATAGSPTKREYLRSLGVEHVFDSRSVAFADEIRVVTGGEGVDLVLNSLAGGEFVPRSLALLRAGGRFLELGKRDLLSAEQVRALEGKVAYHVIDWSDNAREDPALIRGILLEMMAGAARGELPPLPLRSFPLEEAPAAFRFMAQARHTGKVVVTQSGARGSTPIIRPDASYLITGGLSGLGLLTAGWLVEHGARHLALMGRRSASEEAQTRIADLERAGAQVLTFAGDVSSAEDVAHVLVSIAAKLPPLRGIIHSAGALDDGAITNQSWPRFQKVLAPKVNGAAHLHTQTAGMPLDFFVLYSSAAALLGSRGQVNHSAANSFLDALAHHRRANGLPALSINWGAWGEVGAAVEKGVIDRIGEQGVGEIAPAQGLRLLGRMLESAPAQVGVIPISWPIFLRRFAGAVPGYFAELAEPLQTVEQSRLAPTRTEPDIIRRLAEAPPQQRLALLRNHVREITARVLGLPATRIDDETPLSAMGLDSLMAVELRNLLGTSINLQRRLPATLVFDYPTVTAITGYLAAEALPAEAPADDEPVAPPLTPSNGGAITTMIDELENLSDDDIDRLLAEKLRG